MNVELKPNFTQVCVWRNTHLGGDKPTYFERFFQNEFGGADAQFLEVVVNNDGARDLIFAIKDDGIMDFEAKREELGMDYIEDVIYKNPSLYPIRFNLYRYQQLVKEAG